VRQLDRLEMACQALIYERQGVGSLDEFFPFGFGGDLYPEIFNLLDTIKKLH